MGDVIRDSFLSYLPSYTSLIPFPFSKAEASKTEFCNDASMVTSLSLSTWTEGLLGTRNEYNQLVNTQNPDFRE